MRVFTANIKSNPLMRQSRVESDIGHAVHLGGIGFWQEIAPRRYKAALARHATRVGLRVFGLAVECPVTLREAVWTEERHRVTTMHKGRLLVSPTRYAVEVRCHSAQGSVKLSAIGTHMISGAWSTRHMGTRAWRRKQWHIHLRKLQELVRAAHADGYTVLVGMDANKGIDSIALHPDQVILSHHGIDGIFCVPARGVTVSHAQPRFSAGLYTDHEPVSVVAHLGKKAL